jgi:hypothetical protein
MAGSTYHSPVPLPSILLPPLELSWLLPAAAEAKLEVSGDGISWDKEVYRGEGKRF